MNKYQQYLLDQKILRELDILGMQIKWSNPGKRTRKFAKGVVLSINNEPCELLELMEIKDSRELWRVFNLSDRCECFEFI